MLLTDYDTNMVYFSEWIRDFACFNSISEVLKRHCINFELLPFTKDYWIRDFMPVQIAESVFVEYKYNPDYLQRKRAFITDPKGCCTHLHIPTQKIDVVLDGGNIIKCRDAVIMTDKVYAENPTFTTMAAIRYITWIFYLKNQYFMKELIIFIVVFIALFWIGTKLNRWINGTSKIAKNQKKILEELKKQNRKN